MHARPSSLFVQTTSRFEADVKVLKDDQEVNGKSIMGLMMLAAGCGTEIRVIADGTDENELVSAIENLIENKFDEE